MSDLGRNQPCYCGSGKKYKRCCLPAEIAAQAEMRDLEPILPQAVAKKTEMKPREVLKGRCGVTVLMPTRGKPTIETTVSLSALDGQFCIMIPAVRRPVVEARNQLAKAAVVFPDHSPYVPELGWYALFVDDDSFWQAGTLKRMLQGIQDPDIDILAGWFCGRGPRMGPKAFFNDGTFPIPGSDHPKRGCPQDGVVEVERVGFHFVLMKMAVLERMNAAYPEGAFTIPDDPSKPGGKELGEDMCFCLKARALGFRIWVDTGAGIAHIDDDGIAYLPGEGEMRVVGSELHRITDQRTYGEKKLDDEIAASRSGIMVNTGAKHLPTGDRLEELVSEAQ